LKQDDSSFINNIAAKNLMTCQKSLFNQIYDSKQDVFKTVSLTKIFKMHYLKTSSFISLKSCSRWFCLLL